MRLARRTRTHAQRVGIVLPGDVPGRDRRGPAGAAARLSYHHVDGASTAPAFVGDDALLRSIHRVVTVRRTVARVHVESLQLPGTNRRDLARRCQTAVSKTRRPAPRTQVTGTPWSPKRSKAIGRARYSGARHGLPGSRCHHPDASRRRRGDDGRVRHRRQRVVVAHQRPGGAAPHRGVRELIAAKLGARPSEVIFTAGGTESDNLAVKGIYWARRDAEPGRRRIVTTEVEHHAVLDSVNWSSNTKAPR